MGWGSAGSIFDPIAQALIDLDAPPEMKRGVLGPLIDRLRAEDWDTCDESLDEFRDDPVIVSIFYDRGVGNDLYGNAGPDGDLDIIGDRYWTLNCGGCGQIGKLDQTIEGHDALVRQWAVHDHEVHGGDGKVNERMLIGGA